VESDRELPVFQGRATTTLYEPVFSGLLEDLGKTIFELGLLLESLANEAQDRMQSANLVGPNQNKTEFRHQLDCLETQCLGFLSSTDLPSSQREIIALVLRVLHPLATVSKHLEDILLQAPSCRTHIAGIPTRMLPLGKEVHSMLRESLEALERVDLMLARDVVSRDSWVSMLSLGARSRITQVLMGGENNIGWAGTCFSVLNDWEEAAGCAQDIAREILVFHKLASETIPPTANPPFRSTHAPCASA
jgi:PhoU domain